MFHSVRYFGVLVAAAVFAAGCNSSGDHMSVPALPDSGSQMNVKDAGGITYTGQIRPLFEKRCSSCHNSASTVPNWLDYNTAFQKRAAILQKVFVERTMPAAPLNTSMSDEERGLIAAWVKAGAPKGSEDSGPGGPTQPGNPAGPGGPGVPPLGPLPSNCTDKPALFAAALAGKAAEVDALLTQGGCADYKDGKGRTALLGILSDPAGGAQGGEFPHVVSSLLSAGADPNFVYSGGTGLIWAEFNDYADLAVMLVEHGADANVRVAKGQDDSLASQLGYTPLMMAVQNGNPDEVNLLLANGANVAAQTDDGTSATRLAGQISDANKRPVILQLLAAFAGDGALHAPSYARDVQPVFQKRCQTCHNPASPAMNWLSYDVAFKKRALIFVRAVGLKDMPMNDNITKMTDEERGLLSRWIQTGALK